MSGKIVYEVAELWFHTLVLLAHQGLGPDAVLAELEKGNDVVAAWHNRLATQL